MLVGLYWLVAAFGTKPTARRQSYASRARQLVLLILASAFLWWDRNLTMRFLPDAGWVVWIGFVLTVAGCAFAVWARAYLGSNWSGTVTVKKDHELICKGPYAIVRHPIYFGLLVGVAGTALAIGEVRAIFGFVLVVAGLYLKSRYEEQFMREQFNGEYVRYSQRVKRLIPFVL